MKNKNLFVPIFFFLVFIFYTFLIFSTKWNFPDIVKSLDLRWVSISDNLFDNGTYSYGRTDSHGNIIPTFTTPPVFPLLYFGAYSIFGHAEIADDAVKFITIYLCIGIMLISYHIGGLFSYKVGCVTAIIAFLDFSPFYWANNYKTPDMVVAFLMSFSIYYLVKFIKFKRLNKYIVLCSLFLGLAALTKPSVYLLWLPLSLFLFLFSYKIHRNHIAKACYPVVLFLIIQIIFIGGWKVRNYYATGYSDFSSQSGMTLLFWDSGHLKAYQEGSSFWPMKIRLMETYITKETEKMDEGAQNLYFSRIGKKIILGSPIDYAVLVLKRTPVLLLSSPPPDFLLGMKTRENIFRVFQIKTFAELSSFLPSIKTLWVNGCYSFVLSWGFIKSHLLWIYLMSCVGTILMLKNKSDYWVLIGMLIIIAGVVVITSPISQSRYRAPLMPIFYVLSGYGMVHLWQTVKRWKNSEINSEK